MRKNIHSGLTLLLITCLVASCSSTPNTNNYYTPSKDSNLVASPTPVVYSPSNIVIFNHNETKPIAAQHIQKIEVDTYNEYGIRRQQAQINELLKKQACSLGGNAVVLIDEPNDDQHCYAEVIHITKTPNSVASSPSTSATDINLAKTTQIPAQTSPTNPSA